MCDLGFVGTGYPSRINFFEAMDLAGLNVKLGGNWMRLGAEIGGALDADTPLRKYIAHDLDSCMDNTDAADLYRSARAQSICTGVRPLTPNSRPAGLWDRGRSRSRRADLLPERPARGRRRGPSDAAVFADPGDAADKLRFYLGRPNLRANLARQAREAIAERTFTEGGTGRGGREGEGGEGGGEERG